MENTLENENVQKLKEKPEDEDLIQKILTPVCAPSIVIEQMDSNLSLQTVMGHVQQSVKNYIVAVQEAGDRIPMSRLSSTSIQSGYCSGGSSSSLEPDQDAASTLAMVDVPLTDEEMHTCEACTAANIVEQPGIEEPVCLERQKKEKKFRCFTGCFRKQK